MFINKYFIILVLFYAHDFQQKGKYNSGVEISVGTVDYGITG